MIIDETLAEADFDTCFGDEPSADIDPTDDLVRGRSRRRRRRARSTAAVLGSVAIVAVVAITVPSVSREAGPVAPPPTPSPSSSLLPPDADHRLVYGGDVYSDPWPADAPAVRVSAADALGTASASWREKDPVATLRMVSSDDPATRIPRVPTPYWVITWTHPGAMPVGKYVPGESEQVRAERAARFAAVLAVDSTFVDATTGKQSPGIIEQPA